MRNFLLLLCIPFIGLAQTDYELEFNSATQDYVQMSNASSVIANKIAFSMSAWVYPQANPSAHSGIMGFRNNTDADFYLLQLQNSNNVEARFRGSSGVNYDIVATNLLDFNQWQHLAFTYDGSYIRLYKDGALVDSSAATGIIGQNTLPLQLGKLDWGTTGFYMTGRLDEIRLWDVALSQTEINSWMCTPIDLTHPNYNHLMGYWRLNDGQGTIAYDQTANGNNGTLMGGTQWQISTTCFGSTTPPLTYVPDDNFENYLEANGMGDGIALNDNVLTSAIDTVAYLDVSNQSISDLTGIEGFYSLKYLYCYSNQLTSIDITQNIFLEVLACDDNNLSSLDVTQNIFLNYLDCTTNNLSSLNVTQNDSLHALYCSNNQLTTLDVSNNIFLEGLNCSNNLLSSIDVSQNIWLHWFPCHDNFLTTIDVSNNLNLHTFMCYNNLLTSLDLTNNFYLEYLGCSGNQISSINLHLFSQIIDLVCHDNDLTSLDLSNHSELSLLVCYDNNLEILDLSSNINLTSLWCENNQLTFLDVSNGNNTTFTHFSAQNNSILTCINVDNASYSTTNWTDIDPQHYFSTNCPPPSAIQEHTTTKELLRTTDLLGRETKQTNQPLFYIYDDGTVDKQIIVE